LVGRTLLMLQQRELPRVLEHPTICMTLQVQKWACLQWPCELLYQAGGCNLERASSPGIGAPLLAGSAHAARGVDPGCHSVGSTARCAEGLSLIGPPGALPLALTVPHRRGNSKVDQATSAAVQSGKEAGTNPLSQKLAQSAVVFGIEDAGSKRPEPRPVHISTAYQRYCRMVRGHSHVGAI
jgi:hypothetical protein